MEEGKENGQRRTTDEEEEEQQQKQQRLKLEPGTDHHHWKSDEEHGEDGPCDCSSKTRLRDLRANVLELITMLVPDFDMGQVGSDIDLNSSKVDDLITEFISGVSAK